MRHWVSAVVAALLIPGWASAMSFTQTYTWSGNPITGEAGVDSPDFLPEGSAVFEFDGSTLTLTLTYTGATDDATGAPAVVSKLNQSLTGFIWEMTGFVGTLDPVSAIVPTGSSFVGADVTAWMAASAAASQDPRDVSGQWAYKDGIVSDLGSYGVATMGDLVQVDTFGPHDLIDGTKQLISPAPGGGDFALVGPLWSQDDGFKNTGPQIQNALVLTWNVDGELTASMFGDGTPVFGTDGMPPVPEPSSTVLFIAGGVVVGVALRRRSRSG